MWALAALPTVLAFAPPPPPSAVQPSAAEQAVVVLAPRKRGETTDLVIDAIRTQVGELPAEVVVQSMGRAKSLPERLGLASRAATQHEAVGVFWVEEDADGGLILHLVDPAGERMLVRRVAPLEDDAATADSVAVIARSFTAALLEGRAIGLEPVSQRQVPPPPPAAEPTTTPEPGPEPQPDAGAGGPPDRVRGRISADYVGQSLAPEEVWQHGLDVATGLQLRKGAFFGVGYSVLRSFTAAARYEAAGTAVVSEVRRHPIAAFGGYQRAWEKFALEGELRAVLDVTTVEATTIALVDGTTLPPDQRLAQIDDRSLMLGFSPRLRLHYRPVHYFSLQLAAGVDLQAVNRRYFVDFFDPSTGAPLQRVVYLQPRIARPIVSAGFMFFI